MTTVLALIPFISVTGDKCQALSCSCTCVAKLCSDTVAHTVMTNRGSNSMSLQVIGMIASADITVLSLFTHSAELDSQGIPRPPVQVFKCHFSVQAVIRRF